MRVLIALCFLIFIISARRDKKCVDDEYKDKHPINREEEGEKRCKKMLSIEEIGNVTQPFYHDMSVRFNQMQRLHLIGGSVICNEEIEHAFLRLLYLYSCIFPAIQGINLIKNETYLDRDYIVFQDVSELDRKMQNDNNGRLFLHRHKKGDEEQLRTHLVQFIRDLNRTNNRGNYGKEKLYREFCSNRTQHADAAILFKNEKNAGDTQFETLNIE